MTELKITVEDTNLKTVEIKRMSTLHVPKMGLHIENIHIKIQNVADVDHDYDSLEF